jgi:hypothetical protein
MGNSLPQGFKNFILLRPFKINLHKGPNSTGQRQVHFWTLLQVPISLYGESRNLNNITVYVHLEYDIATRMNMTVAGVWIGNRVYCTLNRKSKLSLENKLFIYKHILKPIWTYGIELWGCRLRGYGL